MAKEEKNKKGAEAPVVATEDNIREQLDKATLGRKELADAALEKIKKDHDERTQKEMANRFQQASYQVERGLLNLRRERDIARITHAELIQRDRLARHLMGFEVTEAILKNASRDCTVKIKNEKGETEEVCSSKDIFGKETIDEKAKTVTVLIGEEKKTFKVGEHVPPIIDYVDYDELKRKIPEATNKATRAIENEHNKYSKKLDAAYDRYWEPSWRW